jgi:hypothetical protein
MKLSRNCVRRIIRKPEDENRDINSGFAEHLPLVTDLYKRCNKNAVRVQEVLQEKHGIDIPYSTLTRLLRDSGIKEPSIVRSGTYNQFPGEEMQHDTSPHHAIINGKETKVECASLVMAYCRMGYIQYYPRFGRFEAKEFLRTALVFLDGSCEYCVIDNTSVILAGNSGANAIFAPEMEDFGRIFDFRFKAHEINKPNRKANVERFFRYVEGNFLAGRTFESFADLNQQAEEWCRNKANKRAHRELGMSPIEAYLIEKPALRPLPVVLPPNYKSCQRRVDIYGYVSVDTNRYSVPERLLDKVMDIHVHWEKIKIYYKNELVTEHQRVVDKKDTRVLIPEHHKKRFYAEKNSRNKRDEDSLRKCHAVLDLYLSALKKQKGYKITKTKRLLSLYTTYPSEAVIPAIEEALEYGLYDLNRVEGMIIKNVSANYFNLKEEYGEDEDF